MRFVSRDRKGCIVPRTSELACHRRFIRMEDFKYHNAALEGRLEVVNDALQNDESLIRAKDDSGRTLLHWAAVSGKVELVELLLEHGAVPDLADETGWTPLMCAACAGHVEVVRLLVGRGVDVNAHNEGGHSALQYAASKNRHDVVSFLLGGGADVNKRDRRGATALHRAASQGHTGIVSLLLQHNPTNLNLQDAQGNTPFHLACEEERAEVAKLLFDAGADDSIVNKEGRTPRQMIPEPLPKNHIPGLGNFYPS